MKSRNILGNIGELLAVHYYDSLGWEVLKYMNEKGQADLLIIKDGIQKRIQCKYTDANYLDQGRYYEIKFKRSENNRYSKNSFDILFATTPRGTYIIPSEEIFKEREKINNFRLYPKWDRYKVIL